jgi:hypothetical protein
MSLEELVRRMRLRADTAATLAAQSGTTAHDPGSPAAFGATFWRTVCRETELVHALLASATADDAPVLADRAMPVIALKENSSRRAPGRAAADPTEQEALQVVLHELRMDVQAWLQPSVQ